ncbi:hypothetical protein J31TS4_42860 [Paenibacillus sp. J31TS4]|uniref:DUF4097 family beta strand repeat-containing protein n=1 Tax=Paenibacillus sp. J31TS4 TaxID=2807195 RepID=UPI001B040358|nr:DUF4097 family beta strand repeat-containing protein [Paenibacillus sp. J31TS4]GIP41006.1 hypothetical protein J31TS4_42860 [Paenibacillus sp. J31TS4]
MKIGFKLLISLAVLCILVGGIGVAWSLQEFRLSEPEQIGLVPIEIEKTFEADKVKSMRLSAGTSNVVVTKSTGSDVKLRLTGSMAEANKDYARLDAKLSPDGELVVDARSNKTFHIGIDLTQILALIADGRVQWPTLEVSLPDKVYERLDLRADTGAVRMSGLQADTLLIKLGTGKVELSDFRGKDAVLQTDTGAIRGSNIEAELRAVSDTGSIQLDLPVLAGGVEANSDTGSIRIQVKEDAGFRLEATTDIGSLNTNLPGLSFEQKERRRWAATNGDGGPLIKLTNDIGSVAVNSLR